MQRNLYISNIHESLGYHIAQFYRKDHLEVNPATRIVGSASAGVTYPWIHAAIDVQLSRFSLKNSRIWLAGRCWIAARSF